VKLGLLGCFTAAYREGDRWQRLWCTAS